jgi:hypothetical protein
MPPENTQSYRRAIYERELHAPELTFPPNKPEDVEILAFHRQFEPVGAGDEGYVLLTNGMSDRRMTLSEAAARANVPPRAELMWCVRDPTPDIISGLRWLAVFPFIDETWLGFGHRTPLPWPLVAGSDFKTYLLLTPIIKPDERIAESLTIDGDAVEILTVNLISDAEYAFIKAEGLDPFLDILDENNYPKFFDPGRQSYI